MFDIGGAFGIPGGAEARAGDTAPRAMLPLRQQFRIVHELDPNSSQIVNNLFCNNPIELNCLNLVDKQKQNWSIKISGNYYY